MNQKTFNILEYNKIKDILSNYAHTVFGKELIVELFPSTDLNEVLESQEETTQGVECLSKRGSPPIADLPDVRHALKKVELDAVLVNIELINIGRILKTVRNLKSYSSEAKENYKIEIIDSLINSLVPKKALEDEIYNAILSEDEISDNASDNLRKIRREVADTNNKIKDKLNQIIHSSSYNKFLQDNLVTIRDGRYVVPVKQEYRNEIKGLVHDSSSTGATLFIEPMAVVEANNKLKELRAKEKIEIEVILANLTALVKEILADLRANVLILGKLDYIFAKARFSIDYWCSQPKINNTGYINLKKARHPLINKDMVVPIDLYVGEEFKSLVITGPNTGGKTVSLKTVGLFVLMAQSGLHIPAKEESEISIFNKVFADIGDEQSIEQSLSTFSSHMTNIVDIIKNVDNKSLCLFDELGAGTDPTEGAALAMSILKYLYGMGCLTIATTHYSEIKVFALSTPGFYNASCEFDVETLRPTYKVLMGVPGKSNAFLISKRLGLNDDIIESARQSISSEEIRFEDVISSLHKEKETLESQRQLAEKYRREVEELKRQIEVQKREVENNTEKILLEAKQKALEILDDVKEESEELIKEIKKASKVKEEREREQLLNEAREKLRSKYNKAESDVVSGVLNKKHDNKPPKSVKPGETVYITNIDQRGTVLTAPDDHGNLQIQVGIMKISSNLKHLKVIEESQSRNVNRARTANNKSFSISSEIDLRGQLLDDALMAVDKYLDDAAMSGLAQVTIIHGKGTGALRTGIQQFLRKHPHVRTFRLGTFGEGESGVTIVEVK